MPDPTRVEEETDVAIPGITIEAPSTPSLPFGLTSVADVSGTDQRGIIHGFDYQTLCGLGTTVADDPCQEGTPTTKVANATLETIDGVPFTVYTMFECRPVGMSDAERDRIAMQALTNGESHALEQYLLNNVFTTATDITPAGGAVSPKVGLAALEQYAAANYAGVPTIHVNRGTGSLLAGAIGRHGNRLESEQGALIASGGGYTNAYAADGDSVMYLTGLVRVRRGVAHSHMAQRRTGADYLNDVVALAERTYVVSTECLNVKISVVNDPS